MIQRNLDGNSIIIRLEMKTKTINFGEVASAISQAGGDIVAIDVISTNQDITVRDLTVAVSHADDNKKIVETVRNLNGVSIINVSDRTFLLHLGAKLKSLPNPRLTTGRICREYTHRTWREYVMRLPRSRRRRIH